MATERELFGFPTLPGWQQVNHFERTWAGGW
jgi:hypothetical protein